MDKKRILFAFFAIKIYTISVTICFQSRITIFKRIFEVAFYEKSQTEQKEKESAGWEEVANMADRAAFLCRRRLHHWRNSAGRFSCRRI